MTDGSASPSVLALISAGLTEVKEAVNTLSRDLHGTLARLPNDYVPRRELERRLDELVIDLGAERARSIAEIQALRDAARLAEVDRQTSRRWFAGLAVATACSMTGVLSGIFLHFN